MVHSVSSCHRVCRVFAAAVLCLAATTALVPSRGAETYDESLDRFVPLYPTLSLTYEVRYRFLFLNLMNVATVEIECTEGKWPNAASGEWVNANLVELRIHTLDDPAAEKRNRISIHRRIATVLDSDKDQDTLVYLKEADEFLNPVFGSVSRTRFFEMYDMQFEPLHFLRRDLLQGTLQTNLVGDFELSGQGKEVGSMLRVLSDVHHGRQPMLNDSSSFRLYVNIDGIVTPFSVATEMARTPHAVLGRAHSCLRARVRPAPEAKGRGSQVLLWAVSFAELAEFLDKKELAAMTDRVSNWHMLPLVAEYGLAMGALRGHLSRVRVMDHRGE